MGKAADAFRTISEVADWLEVPAHVLRFWESKFTQIKPVKRAGGRRYYRPADMTLIGGIKALLHDQGMTIKGAQKYLRENGIQHVCGMSPPLDDESTGEISGIALDVETAPARPADVLTFAHPGQEPEPDSGTADATDNLADTAKDESDISQAADHARAAPTTHSAARDPEPEADTAEDEPLSALEPEPAAEPDDLLLSTPVPVQTPETTDYVAAETTPPPEPFAEPDLPADPSDTLAAAPGLLTALSTLPRPVSPELARRFAPLVAALRAQAASHAKDR
ncbi:MAG: MerR family transcriptional regulator [Roseovarius sp. BRH_c41]|uniref:MerR family transcriptional regulator n=1 Tax=Roseovarius sp. BRH_c41 TaxID=1629709 RepID=UPI0005F17A26|nr:MerR family transcriptional regulator [Roseovarius sp. BRH_c41]KJS42191.1 MAG: MerR family transcriptional regulator [Roseovarius sp. BRH_c41]